MKVFKTLEEQVNILIDRGLVIDDHDSTMEVLEFENYYNLINGYSDLFVHKDKSKCVDAYQNDATFNEILSLYLFDKKLKNTFLKRILKLENNFKSTIAHDFSRAHGNKDYLKVESFENFSSLPNIKNGKVKARVYYIESLIKKVEHVISEYTPKKDYLRYYTETHGYIPLWVLVNSMSFGVMSKFYSLMKQKEKVQVSRSFNVSKESLETYIKALTEFRNICAHDERLYTYKLSKKSFIKDTKYHKFICTTNKGGYLEGKRDLFACVIIFKELLSKSDFSTFFVELKQQIDKLSKELNSISVEKVLGKMGFPEQWDSIYIY